MNQLRMLSAGTYAASTRFDRIDHRALRLMISTVRTQMCSHAMIICLGCSRFVHTISTYIHCDIPLECTNGTTLSDGCNTRAARAARHREYPGIAPSLQSGV